MTGGPPFVGVTFIGAVNGEVGGVVLAAVRPRAGFAGDAAAAEPDSDAEDDDEIFLGLPRARLRSGGGDGDGVGGSDDDDASFLGRPRARFRGGDGDGAAPASRLSGDGDDDAAPASPAVAASMARAAVATVLGGPLFCASRNLIEVAFFVKVLV